MQSLSDLAGGCMGEKWNQSVLACHGAEVHDEAACLPAILLQVILPHLNPDALQELDAVCRDKQLSTYKLWQKYASEKCGKKWNHARIFEDDLPDPRQTYWNKYLQDLFGKCIATMSLFPETFEPMYFDLFHYMSELRRNAAHWKRLTLSAASVGRTLQNLPLMWLIQKNVKEICIMHAGLNVKICCELQLLLYLLVKYGKVESLVIKFSDIDIALFGLDGERSGIANLTDETAELLAKTLGYSRPELLLRNQCDESKWPQTPEKMWILVNENKIAGECFEIKKMTASSDPPLELSVESVLMAATDIDSQDLVSQEEEDLFDIALSTIGNAKNSNQNDNGCRLKKLSLINSELHFHHANMIKIACLKLLSSVEKLAFISSGITYDQSCNPNLVLINVVENLFISLVEQNLSHLKIDSSINFISGELLPKVLAAAVSEEKPMQVLDVLCSGNFDILAELQTQFKGVYHLILRCTNVENWDSLVHILKNNTILRHLSFHCTSYDDSVLQNCLPRGVLDAVQRNKQLENLHILDILIPSFEKIAETITNLPNLRLIRLSSSCSFSLPADTAIREDFVSALVHHPILEEVILTGNRLGATGSSLIEKICLAHHRKKFKYFCLGYNYIKGADLLRAARKVAEKSPKLIFDSLSLVGNMIYPSDKQELMELLGKVAHNILLDDDCHILLRSYDTMYSLRPELLSQM